MNIFIIGHRGFLGQKMVNFLRAHHTILTDSIFDITIEKTYDAMHAAHVIVNCAAKTNVDWCEENEEEAFRVNAEGVEKLMEWGRVHHKKIIQISTDWTVNPLNVYAHSKKKGDDFILAQKENAVIYVCNLYGYNSPSEVKGFPLWALEKFTRKKPFSVARGILHTSTWIDDIPRCVQAIISQNKTGRIVCTDSTSYSKMDVALLTARVFGKDPSLIQEVDVSQLPWKAQRPEESNLYKSHSHEKGLYFYPCTTLEEGLMHMKKQMQEGNHPLAK